MGPLEHIMNRRHQLFRKVEALPMEAAVLCELGETNAKCKYFDAAIDQFQRARQLYEQLDEPDRKSVVQKRLKALRASRMRPIEKGNNRQENESLIGLHELEAGWEKLRRARKCGFSTGMLEFDDFHAMPRDIATAVYYTGIDPFTKQEVYVAKGIRDRKMQRALMQFFKPGNYFEVREALIQAGRSDLIGGSCDT